MLLQIIIIIRADFAVICCRFFTRLLPATPVRSVWRRHIAAGGRHCARWARHGRLYSASAAADMKTIPQR